MMEGAVKIVPVKPEKPLLGKSNFDAERLITSLHSITHKKTLIIDRSLWAKLPYILRRRETLYALLQEGEREIYLVELFEVLPLQILGCAIDIGSTTIAFYVYDFLHDRVLEEFSIYNPQIEIGDDILTRLHFARKEENLQFLRRKTLDAINRELSRFPTGSIYYLSICGNTAMTHFLLGLPVNFLIVEPYVPVMKWIPLLKAEEVEVEINPLAKVFFFPLAGTYFGGDLIAGLYEVELNQKDGFSFYLDVGTNAEVVLGNRDFLLACAGAAGPALEGGIFECGVRAMPGAIESCKWDPESATIHYRTIGGLKPVGFCGSAAISLIAEAFLHGFISPEGKLLPQTLPERITTLDGERVLFLLPKEATAHGRPLYIKEGEIRSFLRSKGTMYTILSLLCEKVGLSFEEIDFFYVAGSFGNHIDIRSAVILGMLPEEALNRAVSLGNSAGKGALKFLRKASFEDIKSIIDTITYIELNVEKRLMELLTGALLIPHIDLDRFPWVKKQIEEKRRCFRR
ncbi:MAG: ASKHA domain-containing protein [Caldimicrobium sp.]|nr:ASKHA domain-containing protein [Caldimicrobium sp.]MDW8182701.1 ASKHA domain-containing protein [Caldimicrobium sp.]